MILVVYPQSLKPIGSHSSRPKGCLKSEALGHLDSGPMSQPVKKYPSSILLKLS